MIQTFVQRCSATMLRSFCDRLAISRWGAQGLDYSELYILLQAAKRDCRMFVGLKSMARMLERLEMKLAKHNRVDL